jgi:TonB family protein
MRNDSLTQLPGARNGAASFSSPEARATSHYDYELIARKPAREFPIKFRIYVPAPADAITSAAPLDGTAWTTIACKFRSQTTKGLSVVALRHRLRPKVRTLRRDGNKVSARGVQVTHEGDSSCGLLAPLLSPQAAEVVRLDPAAAAANLQSRIAPDYPALARAARVSGVVTLDSTINKEGRVADLKVLKGHALLNDSALQAVHQWQYKPHAVNSQPVEVATTITINFSLIIPPSIPFGMASISGRVIHTHGRPAAGISVDVALPAEPNPPPSPSSSFTEVSGEYRLLALAFVRPGSLTDNAGEYRIERLGAGAYRVFARVNQDIYFYPGASIEKAVIVTIQSNDVTLVGIDVVIP